VSLSTDPWKITQIEEELKDSYDACNSEFERSVWRIYVAKDCEWILNGRKPSPCEQAILDQYQIVVKT